jgi:hypothetical protein
MSLLPPPGPARRRLFLMVSALAVLSAFLYWRLGGQALPVPTTTGPPRASNLAGQATAARPIAAAVPQTPQPLKFPELEQVPVEPKAGRNLFRFGVPPPPPPPPPVERPTLPPPPPRPTPVGPPPVPLAAVSRVDDPYEAGRVRVYLRHTQTNAIFEVVEGEVVDGQYKLLKVNRSSVVVAYLDGTGQRTLNFGG